MFCQVCILSVVFMMVAGDAAIYPRLSTADVDFDPNPQYSYSYSVADAHTGDNHAQEETRNGDNVHGSYSLIEADGSLRTVKYTADAVNGFNAVVEHSGGSGKSFAVPSAPPAQHIPAYSTPAYVAPVAKFVAPAPVPRPYAFHSGPSSVHTSFSAPHASYQY